MPYRPVHLRAPSKGRLSVFTRLASVFAVIAALVPLVASAPSNAASSGTPAVTVTETAPVTVLYGTSATVSVKAQNLTATNGYNLTFADVLPVGVSYVASSTVPSSFGQPTAIANAPSAGKTTLVWSNVADLQAGSTSTISFQIQGAVEPAANTLYPGKTYSDATSAWVNTDARTVPRFDAVGAIVAGSWTGTGDATGTTQVVPIDVTEDENSPEHELPRGVHDHKATYTVTVKNNTLNPTNTVYVDEYLPAALEFLGCGGVDNTTAQAPEYAGSGNLTAGTALAGPSCFAPDTVEVKTLVASGGVGSQPAYPLTAGSTVYTHVRWSIGSMAASATKTFTYLAAVPLKSNSNTWTNGTPALTGAQTANLDNNSGAQTQDGLSLRNFSVGSGTYSGTLDASASNPISATYNKLAFEAIDLAIQKDVNSTALSQGAIHDWTLNYQASEYRYSTTTVITDVLPNGECPLGSINYDSAASSDCAPQGGHTPSTAYSTVHEEANGDFTITWNLGTLSPNTSATITYPSADRTHYQSSGMDATPTLSQDKITNVVNIDGTVRGTCRIGTSPDPTCAGAGTVLTGETTPSAADNASSEDIQASSPVLTKLIAAPPVSGTTDCAHATYASTVPAYGKNDTICFQLKVAFPSGSHGRNVTITDLLPPNATYVPGSAHAVAPGDTGSVNDVTVASFTPTAASGGNTASLNWTLGDTIGSDLYVSPGQVFSYDIAMTADADPTVGNTFDIVDNLMKLSEANTQGATISLRADQTYKLSRPILGITKGIKQVNAGAINGVNVSPVSIDAGDTVTYRIDLTNNGLLLAQAAGATDTLPPQITSCAAVSSISDGGVCSGSGPSTITWTNLADIAAGSKTLTYVVATPSTLAAGEQLTNTAAVTSYQSVPNNSAAATTYTPGVSGEPAATDTAIAKLDPATMTMSVVSETTESGNSTAASTLGEINDYTINVTIPAGTSVYDGIVTNPMASNKLTYVAGTVALQLDGGAATGFSSSVTGNILEVDFPSTFTSTTTNRVLQVTFKATTTDVSGNVRGSSMSDISAFNYNNFGGAAQPTINANANLTVAEPRITVNKTDNKASSASPGDAVTYTITIGNANTGGNVSKGHNIEVTDVLPAGMSTPTSITPTPTSISGNTYVWDLPDINVNGTSTITYTASIPNPSTGATSFANTATVTSSSLDPVVSPLAKNYSASKTDTVLVPGVAVAQSVTPTQVNVGQSVPFTLTVTIPANTDLPDLTVINTLPDGSTFASYGSSPTCMNADTTACSFPMASLPTPAKIANGTTSIAWFVGDVTASTQARTVTLTYNAYPAKTNHSSVANVAGTVLTASAKGYWNATSGTDPTTIPLSTAYGFSSTAGTAAMTVTTPVLSVTKSASTSAPTPGVPFTYTVTAQNSNAANTSAAYDVTITDVVPSGLAVPSNISNGGSYNSGTRTISWTLAGSIAVNASQSLTFDTSVLSTDTTGQVITNSATITGYDAVSGGNAADSTRYPLYGPTSGSTPVTATFPTLTVAKVTSANNETDPAVGEVSFGWKVTVANSSTAAAASTTVADTLPSGWSYDAGSAKVDGVTIADPTLSGGILTFTVGSVAGSGSRVLTYNATPSSSTTFVTPNVNTARAYWQDGNGATANGTGSYASATDTASATIAAANLAITKSSSSSIVPGTTSTWLVSVTNNGPSSTGGVVTVVDTFPAGVTSVSGGGGGSGWTCGVSSNVLTCTHATMANAATSNFNVAATLPTGTTGSVVNTASVSSTTYDPNTSDNIATATTSSAPAAVLNVSNAHTGNLSAGSQGTLTFTLHNNGPSDATTVAMTDPLPAGLTYLSYVGPNYSCSADASQVVMCTRTGTLLSGATDTVTITVAVSSGHIGAVSDTVTATAANAADVTSTDTASAVTPIDDLQILLSHTGHFTAGTDGTYAITVNNLGPADGAGPITVVDTLPTGVTFISSNTPGWSCTASGPTVTCTRAAALVAGISTALTLSVHVDAAVADGTPLTDHASVGGPTSDSNATNNAVDDPTIVDAAPKLGVTLTPPSSPYPGNNATWNVSVTNTGPSVDAGPITVSDTIPTGTAFVSATGDGWTCTYNAGPRTVACTSAVVLAPGATASSIDIKLAIGMTANLTVGNTVTATSPTSADVLGADPPQDSTVTPILPLADMSIEKHHVSAVSKARLSYLLTPTNNGPTADPGVVTVTDILPRGETFVSANGTGWTCAAASSTVTCERTGAALGAQPAITLSVLVDAKAMPSVTNVASVASTATDPKTTNQTDNDTVQVLAEQLVRDSSLARTGFNAVLWVNLAAAMIISGAMLLYVAERLRRRSVS